MNLIAYFGYGSLVNLQTLQTRVVANVPARLKGWRRHWQSRPPIGGEDDKGDIALLSVHEHEASEIDGVLVIDRIESLPALDLRERCYDRIALSPDAITLLDEFSFSDGSTNCFSQSEIAQVLQQAFVYRGIAVEENGAEQPKLLQSYLDVVLSGFSAMHGVEGMDRFVQTTVGFEREMIADRKNPIYPRAVCLDEARYRVHDELLRRAGVKRHVSP